jgi:hypothetical protein
VVLPVVDGSSGISLAVENRMDGPILVDLTANATPPAEPE